MTTEDLTKVESHFRFGENWTSFVDHVDRERIDRATDSLARLVTPDEMRGKSFLDIGCGSGLSMLAALELGAARVRGVDLDPQSVGAARKLLGAHRPASDWSAEVRSVFDLSPDTDGGYDIVHSWGVLHHTGDMERAVGIAASLVPPGGLLVIALYRKTRHCGRWTRIKRSYSRAGPVVQAAMRTVYSAMLLARMASRGTNPIRYLRVNPRVRGMRFSHDAHDWLGGYPYESVVAEDFVAGMKDSGFELLRCKVQAQTSGLLGAGCDEFVLRRTA